MEFYFYFHGPKGLQKKGVRAENIEQAEEKANAWLESKFRWKASLAVVFENDEIFRLVHDAMAQCTKKDQSITGAMPEGIPEQEADWKAKAILRIHKMEWPFFVFFDRKARTINLTRLRAGGDL